MQECCNIPRRYNVVLVVFGLLLVAVLTSVLAQHRSLSSLCLIAVLLEVIALRDDSQEQPNVVRNGLERVQPDSHLAPL